MNQSANVTTSASISGNLRNLSSSQQQRFRQSLRMLLANLDLPPNNPPISLIPRLPGYAYLFSDDWFNITFEAFKDVSSGRFYVHIERVEVLA